jgi:hypothetical protein
MAVTEKEKRAIEDVMDALLSVTSGRRNLATMFRSLPDGDAWKEYYKIIPEPRSLDGIKVRFRRTYISLCFSNSVAGGTGQRRVFKLFGRVLRLESRIFERVRPLLHVAFANLADIHSRQTVFQRRYLYYIEGRKDSSGEQGIAVHLSCVYIHPLSRHARTS